MKPTEHNAFLNEALETLNRIDSENKHLTQLRWFLETALQRFNKDYLNSRKKHVKLQSTPRRTCLLHLVIKDIQ